MGAVVYRVRSVLRRRWRSTLALTVIVAVVAGAALALVGGAVRTLTAPDRYTHAQASQYDVALEQSGGPPRVQELAAVPSLTRVATASFTFGGVTPDGGSEPLNTYVFIGSGDALGQRIVEGRVPAAGRIDEFVVSRTFAKQHGAHIGDRFTLQTFTQAQADAQGFEGQEPPAGFSESATVVGIEDGPSALEDETPLALFPLSLLDGHDIGLSATEIVATRRAGATLDDVRRDLDALPNGSELSVEPLQVVSSTVRAAVSAQGQALAVLAAIVAIGALVVLGQLLVRQLRLDDGERSTLRAVGYDRRALVLEPVLRAAVAITVGVVAAIAIAYAASGVFPTGFVRRVEPHVGLRFDALVLLGGAAVAILGLGGFVFVAHATRTRGAADRASASPILDRVATAAPSGPSATGIRFALARRTGPLLALALVSCVLFGALTFGTNLDRLIDHPSTYGSNFDLAVGAGEDVIAPEIIQGLRDSPDVAALMLYGTTNGAVGARRLDVIGMQPLEGDLAPVMQQGRLPAGADEVALGRVAARDLGAHVGDELTITGATGAARMRVAGIGLVPQINGADTIGDAALVSDAGFHRIDPNATYNSAAVKLQRGAGSDATARIAAAIGTPIGPTSRPGAIVNLDRIRNVPFVVAAAVAALALLSLGHHLVMAIRRRRRDLAVLRALGAGRRWITSVVHWQATAIAVIVVVLAAPIGTALGSAVYRRFVDRVGADTSAVVPVALIGLAVASVLVLANVVAAVPARRARRVPPSQLLTAD